MIVSGILIVAAYAAPTDASLTYAAPDASGSLPLRKTKRKLGENLADLESELSVTRSFDTTSWIPRSKTLLQEVHQNKIAKLIANIYTQRGKVAAIELKEAEKNYKSSSSAPKSIWSDELFS